jgi:putative ABC transport system permease protein
MPVLYRASFGFLIRHPWQLGLALLGISIGVAVMVAVDLANASSRKAFLLSMDTLNGQATHQIIGGPEGLDESVYTALRTRQQFRDLAPVIEGSAVANDSVLTLLGIDVFAEQGFRSYTSPGSGAAGNAGNASAAPEFSALRRFLTEPGGALLSSRTAAALGLTVGQQFDLDVGGKTHAARLLGVTGKEGSAAARLDNLLIADIATAQEWLERPGFLTRIDVRLPADPAAEAALRAALPVGVQLLSAAGRTQTTVDMTSAFMTNLTAMSLLALLVGVFLIYNSVGFAVVQRRGLIGVLRALGLTRRQAFRLIMNEGVLLGIVGAALGVGVGIWLGEKLLLLVSQSINDLYFRVAVTDIALSPWSIGKGLAAGLGATLLAAAVPAWEAAGLQPTLSLKRSVLERRAGRLAPVLLLFGLAGVGLALAILFFSADSLVAGLVALFLLILGFGLCIPVCVLYLVRAVSSLVARAGGTSARLAVDGIRSSLSRTGVAIVALAVAVSATVGVSVMVDSFRTAVSDWLGKTLQSDIYVGVERGTMDQSLIEDIVRLDGVEEYSSNRRAWVESAAGRTRVIALSMASQSYAGTELLDASPDIAWQAFDEEGAILVSDPYAYRHRVAAGDSVRLATGLGAHDFRIAATYRSYDANQGAIVMSRRTYDRYWSDEGVDSIGLYLRHGSDPEALMTRIRSLSEGRQALRMNSNRAIRDISLAIFDRTFIITDVLYWLAVGVAIIGILGAMLALQLERARELAVLRALGMTPRQLGAMVTTQTALMGLLSGLAAMPLGLVMAWVLIDVINRRSFGWQMAMTVDPGILGNALALAVVASLMAGLYPAYRAASSSPAAAMREE